MASPIVRALARAAARIFYRIDCAGVVPPEGAVLILPNHANALLDPAILWATAGRDVRFLAKSTLFGTPLRPLLAGAGAIPVYRRLDQGVDTSKNAETFAAVEQALAERDAVCVFPEGISHSAGRLVPLRTGAARMALAAERRGVRVALVAAGLNFDQKTTFRSRVTIVYGRAFSCADLLESGGEPGADAVRALTDRMTGEMQRLLVEADPGGDAALVDRIDRLYGAARGRAADPVDRIARRRAIAIGIEQLRAADPEKFDALYLRFRRYDDRLRRFGLRDRHLDWHISTADAVQFAVRELLLALVLGPVALFALVIFAVPYLVTHWTVRFFREPDVAATAKLIAGATIYTAWVAALASVAGLDRGTSAAIATAVLLPIVAVCGLLAIERESAIVDTIRAWMILRRTTRGTRKRLRHDRSDLIDVLDDVRKWLVNP
jgi:glycerol-3-phosphate O-acyltransferase / dihydroxyacetone phosphate acyltransferase